VLTVDVSKLMERVCIHFCRIWSW